VPDPKTGQVVKDVITQGEMRGEDTTRETLLDVPIPAPILRRKTAIHPGSMIPRHRTTNRQSNIAFLNV
jgi:hypothetical protein